MACSDDDYEPDVKPPKSRRRTTSYRRSVKEETESNDSPDEEMPASDWKVSRTADGEYQLSITCPKKEWLLQSIDGMIKEAAAGVLQSPNQANLRRHAHKLVGLKSEYYSGRCYKAIVLICLYLQNVPVTCHDLGLANGISQQFHQPTIRTKWFPPDTFQTSRATVDEECTILFKFVLILVC